MQLEVLDEWDVEEPKELVDMDEELMCGLYYAVEEAMIDAYNLQKQRKTFDLVYKHVQF